MKPLLPALFAVQKIMLVCSYWFHRMVTPRTKRDSIDWVVGPVELASMVYQITKALPNNYSVSFSESAYYAFKYDYMYRPQLSRRHRTWYKFFFAPLLLGRLMNLARGFLYVGANGFLVDVFDERDFEFRFLKKRGRKLGLYWCGSEIRSPKLMHELEASMGLPNVFTYIEQVSAHFGTPAHERLLVKRAQVGNSYADVMFDMPMDQASYLSGHREPFFYFMPAERFDDNPNKFDDLSKLVVTHATTSPIIKGTQLVRAAIAKLKAEGYDFEYVELIRVGNDVVQQQLRRTHIVLNQFFGFTTAVFGVEAMAARCAVLSSADETIETRLPPGANQANLVTKHWQIYDNLKSLLDHPERIEPLAAAGQEWVRRYASGEGAGALLKGILDSVLDGSYNKADRAALSNSETYGASASNGGKGVAA